MWIAIGVGGLGAGALVIFLVLAHKQEFHQLHKTQWTCVQPYGAPEHECRQWVRTVQRKVVY